MKNLMQNGREVLAKFCLALAAAYTAGAFSMPASAAALSHRPISKTLEAIIVDGELVQSDIDKFRELSLQFKNAVVLLDSEGGNLSAGIEIGKMIRLTGYSTLIPKGASCTSSCALIWLAGSRRLLSPEGRVGFHASYTSKDGRIEQTGVGNAMVGHYLSLLNLPQKAVVFATMAGPSEITWLTAQNKAASGIEFEDFTLDDEPEPIAAKLSAPQRAMVGTAAERSASPHYTLAQMENLMRAELQKPATIDKMLAKANLDPLSSTIFREHIEKLYRNDMLIRRISEELVRAQSSMSRDNAFEMAKEIGKETSSKLTVLGLSRLLKKSLAFGDEA